MNMISRKEECRIHGRATIGRLAAVLAAGFALGALQANAALKYEPSNYAARSNLLLQLDGIRNVGPP